jgi:galactose mutarotase-like enzyme
VAGHHVVLDRESPLLLLDDHGLPIHGVITASRRWVVREVAADSDRARLVSSLDFDRADLLEAFPVPHRVELAVELPDGALQVRTTLTATGSEPVPVAFGFHPYFRLPGLPRTRLGGRISSARGAAARLADGADRRDRARETHRGLGRRADLGRRIRWRRPRRVLQLSGGGRSIEVHYTEGYPVAQIFAPPGAEYVCIEPMTAVANALERPDDELH